ncbi:MAG TPA: hypothetical protein VKB08_22365 [Bradyrhizobium sp.]|nr:hypothetical protein [Bradyrhizobium sp.]
MRDPASVTLLWLNGDIECADAKFAAACTPVGDDRYAGITRVCPNVSWGVSVFTPLPDITFSVNLRNTE